MLTSLLKILGYLILLGILVITSMLQFSEKVGLIEQQYIGTQFTYKVNNWYHSLDKTVDVDAIGKGFSESVNTENIK